MYGVGMYRNVRGARDAEMYRAFKGCRRVCRASRG